MTREVQLVITCDACGGRAPEDEFQLQVQGHKYVLDLCGRDRDRLVQALGRYVPALREEPPALDGVVPEAGHVVPEAGHKPRRMTPELRASLTVRAGRMRALKAACPVEGCERIIGKNNMYRHIGTHGLPDEQVTSLYNQVVSS
jgi:hypothetical protein